VRAIQFDAPGSIDALVLRDVVSEPVEPGEIEVFFLASSINPADVKIRSGAVVPRAGAYPYTLGYDLVGEVVAAGEGVDGFEVGDRVLAMTAVALTGRGSWAETVRVPAASAAKLPDGLEVLPAARLPLAGLTALQAVRRAAVVEGEVVLVAGAAGAVGRAAVDLLLHRGHRVLALVRDAHQLSTLANNGSVDVLTSLPEPGSVDVLLDAAGGDFSAAVKDGGRFVSVVPEALPSSSDLGARQVQRSLVIAQESGADLETVASLAAQGAIALGVGRTFPLQQIHAAHKEYEHNGQRDVVIVRG
jgi:NADPH:quinone reductase-like Zn-dependent oxidoreductase